MSIPGIKSTNRKGRKTGFRAKSSKIINRKRAKGRKKLAGWLY